MFVVTYSPALSGSLAIYPTKELSATLCARIIKLYVLGIGPEEAEDELLLLLLLEPLGFEEVEELLRLRVGELLDLEEERLFVLVEVVFEELDVLVIGAERIVYDVDRADFEEVEEVEREKGLRGIA
jgi:hypothetical protein